MKIGILSDIHGYPEKFKKAMSLMNDCSMILCAGDILYHGPRNPILEGYNPAGLVEEILKNKIPMLIANGNCDAAVDLMVLNLPLYTPVIIYEVDGLRFMVLHGHDVDGKGLLAIAQAYKIDIMISGHSHIRNFEIVRDTVFINPGSIGVPKGDGIPSIAIYENREISFVNIETSEIIEKFPV